MKQLLTLVMFVTMLGAVFFAAQGVSAQESLCDAAIESARTGTGDFARYELVYGGSGGSGSQVIVGTDGPDTLNGGSGHDALCGFGGDDVLIGGAGNDILVGGAGIDQLYGESGGDTLYGGANDMLDDGSGRNNLVPVTDPVEPPPVTPSLDATFKSLGDPLSCAIELQLSNFASNTEYAIDVHEGRNWYGPYTITTDSDGSIAFSPLSLAKSKAYLVEIDGVTWGPFTVACEGDPVEPPAVTPSIEVLFKFMDNPSYCAVAVQLENFAPNTTYAVDVTERGASQTFRSFQTVTDNVGSAVVGISDAFEGFTIVVTVDGFTSGIVLVPVPPLCANGDQ